MTANSPDPHTTPTAPRRRVRRVGAYARAAVDAVRNGPWGFIIVVLLLCAAAGADASYAVSFYGLLLVGAAIALGLRALGMETTNPVDLVKALWKGMSLWQVLALVAAVAGAAGVAYLFKNVQAAALWLADATDSDEDLTTTLLFSIVALLFTVAMAWLRPKTALSPAHAEHVRWYWTEARFNLLLVCLALAPAALLANWAWNVLLSVVLPLFVLSVRSRVLAPELPLPPDHADASDLPNEDLST